MLKKSGLVQFFREYLLMELRISNEVIGVQTKELLSEGGKYSEKQETVLDGGRVFARLAPTLLKYLLNSSAIRDGSVIIFPSTIILLSEFRLERQWFFKLKWELMFCHNFFIEFDLLSKILE